MLRNSVYSGFPNSHAAAFCHLTDSGKPCGRNGSKVISKGIASGKTVEASCKDLASRCSVSSELALAQT